MIAFGARDSVQGRVRAARGADTGPRPRAEARREGRRGIARDRGPSEKYGRAAGAVGVRGNWSTVFLDYILQ